MLWQGMPSLKAPPHAGQVSAGTAEWQKGGTEAPPPNYGTRNQLQPDVPPQVLHFMQVPLRTSV
jgi:hypothetical protein